MKKINPKFIKYFCQSKQYKDWINSFNTGSTRGNINAQTLGKMPIPLIERKIQDTLVSVLSSIDEKIKQNNEINNNLPTRPRNARIAMKQRRHTPNPNGCLYPDVKVSGRGGNDETTEQFLYLLAA